MTIKQPMEEHLERLVLSTIRSLNAIKDEKNHSMKEIELCAAIAKLNRIKECLKNIQDEKIRTGSSE